MFLSITVAGDYVSVYDSPLDDFFSDYTRVLFFNIYIVDDNFMELTEEFSISLSLADLPAVQIIPNISTITIQDDDVDGKHILVVNIMVCCLKLI